MFHLEDKNIIRHQEIGRGAFGSVFPLKVEDDEHSWVVKEQIPKKLTDVQTIMQEIVLAFACDHPNILQTTGFSIKVETEKVPVTCDGVTVKVDRPKLRFYIKSKRMKYDLQYKLSNTQGLMPKEQVIKYFYSLASALDYLHKKRIAHRDIKPANILVDSEENLKLTDIGVGRFVAQGETFLELSQVGGTALYMAPECKYTQKNADLYKADIWSLGILMEDICLLKPKRASYAEDPVAIKEKIEENLKQIEQKYDKELAGLIRDLLNFEQSQRPSADAICEILENLYPHILKKKKPEEIIEKRPSISPQKSRNDNPKDLKKELEKKWKGWFVFEPNKDFEISAKQPLCLKESIFESCMDDFIETLKDYNVKNLKELSLNFQNYTQIKDRQMEKITSQITENIDTLQKLALNFKNSTQITNNGFVDSITCFTSKFRDITDLSLNFESADITDEGLKCLGKSVSKLEKLSLDFSKCTQISDTGIKDFIENADKNLNQLKELSINLLDCDKISDIGRSTLSQYIGTSLKSLEGLELLLHWKDVKGPEITKISSIFSQIQRLNSLSLNFDWSRLAHITTEELRENLGRLKQLQKLSLSFESCREFDDSALKEMCSLLSTDFTNIKQLSLNFDGCHKITTFSPLYTAINSLQNLKELSLNFANLAIIHNDNDEQLKNLGKSLKNLLKLSLDFSECEKLKTSDIRALFDNISESLGNLQDLSINMKKCAQVNDETASEIAKYISTKFLNLEKLCLDLSENQVNNSGVEKVFYPICKNLKNLVKLVLIFESCGEINQGILYTFLELSAADFKKLQHMKLDFRNCENLTLEDKYKFMQGLDYLPQIDIL